MGRFAFVLKRLLAVIPLLVGIIFVVFLLLKITPGNPAREAVGLRASAQAVANAAHVMGLDRSLPGQFWHYVDGVIHGNLGYSFKTNGPVAPEITAQAPITVWLIVVGVLLSLIITIPLAALAALHPDGVVDHIVRALSVTFLAMPVFWVGLMLLTVVAIPTGAFPVAGFGSGFIGHLHSITLPALTLAIGVAPVLVRSLRATMIEVLNSEYVSAARSLGVGGPRLFRRFVLRNALPPMVTLLAVQTGYLLFGAVIVETTFNLPGLGQGLVSAVDNADFPLVQGYTLVFAVAIVLIYLIADIVVAALDPRVVVES